MFFCKYCEIFKNNYFEKQLQTAASVSLAFSSEYTHFNIFTYCFISVEPSLFHLSLLVSEQIYICFIA